mmetsp:Transcript_29285/g.79070  ORF Transcript_29285/g.79070 Transcript_29285/m.79070 type:complete len:121 (+) Transcript_29285:538-900(+)
MEVCMEVCRDGGRDGGLTGGGGLTAPPSSSCGAAEAPRVSSCVSGAGLCADGDGRKGGASGEDKGAAKLSACPDGRASANVGGRVGGSIGGGGGACVDVSQCGAGRQGGGDRGCARHHGE